MSTRARKSQSHHRRVEDLKQQTPASPQKNDNHDDNSDHYQNKAKKFSFLNDLDDSTHSTPSITFSDTADLELREIDSDLYGLRQQPTTAQAPPLLTCTATATSTTSDQSKSSGTGCTSSSLVKLKAKKFNVLRQLQTYGFGTGFQIPFTNADCKVLEQQVEALQEQNVEHKILLRDNKAHNQMMKEHVLNLQHEINSFKRLIDATKLECENIETLAGLAERVDKAVTTDLLRTNEDILNYCERNEWREKLLKSVQDRVEKFIQKHKIGQDKILAYQSHISANEDIMEKIKYFNSLDEQEIFRFEEQDHELVWENRCLRLELDVNAMNTDKLHEVYNRMSSDYRKAFKQRQQLLSFWNRSVEQMKNRDEEIKIIGNQYFSNRSSFLKLRSKLKSAEDKLMTMSDSIVSLHRQQTELDRLVQVKREGIQRTSQIATLLKDEYTLANIEIQQFRSLALDVTSQLNNNYNNPSTDGYEEKEAEMELIVSQLKSKLQAQLEETAEHVCNIERLEELIHYEENRQLQLERYIYKLRQFLWERQLDKNRIHNHAQKLDDRTHRLKINLHMLETKCLSYIDKLSDRRSKDYRLDLDLSSLEVKTIQFLNEALDPRLHKLKQLKMSTKERLEQSTANLNFIRQELFELRLVIDIIRGEILVQDKIHKSLEVELFNVRKEEITFKKIEIDTKKKLTSTLVDANLIKLVLAKTKSRYHDRMNNKMSLAIRKISLESVAKERKLEIAQHVEFLTKQLLEYKERNLKLRIRSANVFTYLKKLMGKFQLFIRLMAPSGDHEPGQNSFANQIKKMAREKEILSSESKKWDNRIQEATKEVEGLRNAILIMDVSNTNYRHNLAAAQLGSKEYEAYQQLRENEKHFTVLKKRAEKIHSHLLDKEQTRLNAVKRLQKIMETQLELANQKRTEASAALAALASQENHIARWDQLLASITELAQRKMNQRIRYDSQIEIILLAIKEKYDHAVAALDHFLLQVPSSKNIVYEFLDERRRSIKLELESKDFKKQMEAEAARNRISYAPSVRRLTIEMGQEERRRVQHQLEALQQADDEHHHIGGGIEEGEEFEGECHEPCPQQGVMLKCHERYGEGGEEVQGEDCCGGYYVGCQEMIGELSDQHQHHHHHHAERGSLYPPCEDTADKACETSDGVIYSKSSSTSSSGEGGSGSRSRSGSSSSSNESQEQPLCTPPRPASASSSSSTCSDVY